MRLDLLFPTPEGIEHLNSIYLWKCAQPPEFDAESVNSSSQMTLEQNEERKRLGRMLYFGKIYFDEWRGAEGWTIDRLLWRHRFEGYQRWITLPRPDAPTRELGALHLLPVEILNMVISQLDVATLDRFKAANRRAFQAVNCHQTFRLLNEEAHDVLRALRAVHLSHVYSVQAVFEALCSEKCTQCGDFGGYMYLAALERICWRCFVEKDRYSPLTEMAALRSFGLTCEILDGLPRFQSYPGGYSLRSREDDIRTYTNGFIQLIDRDAAEQAGVALHGSKEAMDAYVASTNPTVWEGLKEEFDRREKIRIAQRAEKWLIARNKWKTREFHKMEVHERREARRKKKEEEIRGNKDQCAPPDALGSQALHESGLHEDTDDESISTVACSLSEIDEEGEPHFSNSNKTSSSNNSSMSSQEDLAEISVSLEPHGDPSHWSNHRMRFLGTTRVPWLNRQARRTEWGFHCVGCLHCRWPGTVHEHDRWWAIRANERNGLDWTTRRDREFIFSTFKDHLEEYGPIEDKFHRCSCCNKGSCRDSSKETIQHRLYWKA